MSKSPTDYESLAELRYQILAARLRRLDEEHVREPGWVKAWKTSR